VHPGAERNPNAFYDIYDKVTETGHYSNNILIENNYCVGDGVKGRGGLGLSGIMVSFSNNVRIIGNDISGYVHGITYWGGNANTSDGPSPNGFITNERKCKDIAILGNTIRNIDMGGIWGSMGERVAVTGNTVFECGDVGIDFEGSFFCTASGNVVANCITACLCTCYDNRGIMFSGNSCVQNADGSGIAYIQNLRGTDTNLDISFVGNTFTARQGISMVVSEGAQHVLFEGNTLHNVRVDFQNDRRLHFVQVVVGNSLFFDTVAKSSVDAIRVGTLDKAGKAIVSNNCITTTVSQSGKSSGINILINSALAEQYLITSNIVDGWKKRDIFIQCEESSDSSRLKAIVTAANNIADGETVADNCRGKVIFRKDSDRSVK
jgi:hypothetical protein